MKSAGDFSRRLNAKDFCSEEKNRPKKEPSDIIAVLPDKTICYVGTIGRIAAGSGAENVVVVEGKDVSCNL